MTNTLQRSTIWVTWLGSLVARMLDLRLDGHEFDSSRPLQLALEWVTVFGWVNHFSTQADSASYSYWDGKGALASEVMLCAGEQRQDGSFHMWIIAWDVKLCDPSLTCANLSTKSHTLKMLYKCLLRDSFFLHCGTLCIISNLVHGLTTTN